MGLIGIVTNSKAVTDFSSLKGAIADNPGFMPCAPDGDVERNGNFLVVETKTPGEKVSQGQYKYYVARAKQVNTTVVFVRVSGVRYANDAIVFDPVAICKLDAAGNFSDEVPITLEKFLVWYRKWYSQCI